MSKKTLTSVEDARKVLLSLNELVPLERKELIQICVLSLGYTKTDLDKKEQSGGNLNLSKCYLGYALNQLIRTGKIKELDDGRLKFSGEELDLVNLKLEVEEIILSLTNGNAYTKEELLSEVSSVYFKNHPKVENTQDNRNAVRGYAGTSIKSPFIPKSGDRYGKLKKENLRELNARYLDTLSSEEFEAHSVNMLEAYFDKFVYVNCCTGYHCGGQDDGGIDGILTVKDETLGCVDNIYIQVKQKKSENNNAKKKTLHEVREFSGVLAASSEALKGIFVTNINYNTAPKKFISSYKLKPLIYVNGELWLDMADKCGYSIAKHSV